MKKRIWNKVISILTAILLVVGLVPNMTVAVVAAEEDVPATLYVGETDITAGGYWKTTDDGKLISGGASANDYNVYYDGNGTLTLNNATIQGRGYSGNPQPEDYGIYAAPTGNQSVSLTINLMGSNTVSGYCGICVETTTADNASLVIQPAENDPQGSLEAIGNKYNGITISSGSGNASLTINNAPVVAISKSPAPNSYHGVCIKTGNATAPALSLLVNGGSLTAQGESGYGIYFYMGNRTTDPSTSLTVQNNALVKATPSIVISNNLSKPDTTAGSESGGIVFDGKSGTVYGDVTLDESITINQDETLRIPNGSSLNSNNHLTNNGTIIVENGGVLTGETGGKVVYAPSITTESLPEGKVNEEYSASLTADGSEPIEWSVTQGSLPTGLSLTKDGKITGKPTAPGEYVFTVTASNDAGSVSKELTITVKDVDPIYSIQNSGDISFADALEGYTPEVKTIMITNDGNQPITLDQPSSTSFDVGTLSKTELNVGETAEFTVQPKNGLLAGSYEEDIVITGTNNGKSVSTTVNVKFNVKHNAVKVERKDPTCTEKGNIEYWYCEACRKYFQDEAFTKELKQEETIVPATGHNLTKVDKKNPTVDAAGNIEYWYCEVCNKYFSDEKAEHEITLEDTIIAKLPKFVSGANQEWTKGSKEGLTFKIDTDIKEFKKVLVDGKELKDTDYDIKSGSTILTLKPSFLDTLSAGKHKIRFEFNTGSVEAYFTVKDKENSSQTESANTGVQNKYGLWIVLLLVAAGGLAGFGILSKRRKNHK